MIADAMVDTNVLIYAASRLAEDQDKKRIANALLQTEGIGLSAQVLQEFLVVSTRKVHKPWSLDDALDWIEAFEDLPCIPVDAPLVRYGAELAVRYQFVLGWRHSRSRPPDERAGPLYRRSQPRSDLWISPGRESLP